MERLRDRIEHLCKTYEEPEFDPNGKFISKKIKKQAQKQETQDINDIDVNVEHFDDEEMDRQNILREMDLPEGMLVTNLFVPCMVLCSKVDLIEHGEKDIK